DKPLSREAIYDAVRDQLSFLEPAAEAATVAGALATASAPGGVPHGLSAAAAAPAVGRGAVPFWTPQVPQEPIQPGLDSRPRIVLTDQYAPVDNLMAEVYRYRNRLRPKDKETPTPAPAPQKGE